MKAKTKKKIFLFTRYLTRIGVVRGFFLFLRLHIFGRQSNITTSFLKFPFTLRPGTSDLATFDQVFLSRIYHHSLRVTPRAIVDCGANVGMATLYFANRYPDAHIVAIEPEESNVKLLRENCKPYPNIHVLHKAVWYQSGRMKIVDNGTGHYGFSVEESAAESPGAIEAIALDEVMKQFSFDTIDFLKIDIEGSEKEIFSERYEGWLPKTRALTVELHDRFKPGASKAVIKAVAKYDFSVYGSAEGFFCEFDS